VSELKIARIFFIFSNMTDFQDAERLAFCGKKLSKFGSFKNQVPVSARDSNTSWLLHALSFIRHLMMNLSARFETRRGCS